MIRKSTIVVAALAALSVTALTSTEALAHKKGGFHHHRHHHHHHGFKRGFRFGFVGVPAYTDCVKVITPRGRVKLVCYY